MKISRTCIDVYVEGATCVGEPRAGESLHVQESLGVMTATLDAQTSELIRRINPMPVPAYQVPAPYPYCGAYNNGCGCGC